jgi:ubiquinone biosynthesis protein UbiJ
MPATPVWLAAVEALLNRGIGASAQATALTHRLAGTALRLEVVGLTSIRVEAAAGRLALLATGRAAAAEGSDSPATAEADATISGSPAALLRLAQSQAGGAAPGRAGAAPAPAARATIRGDAELANAYRQLFMLARPDWEEELSRLVGDLPARRLSRIAQQMFAWARKASATAGENIAEYLQEESRDLVGKTELDEFLQGVDAVREAADRAAARLAGLERRLQGGA